jgi:arylsulfatase A-like enzyme
MLGRPAPGILDAALGIIQRIVGAGRGAVHTPRRARAGRGSRARSRLRRRVGGGWILLAALAGCAKPVQRPNVLLIVVDTLRADRVAAATTPRIARLAEGGAHFRRAQSPRAKTTPAVASLMTGLYPHDHGVRDLSMRLDGDVPVLAEAFSRAGYRTLGIVGNFVMTDARSGLARGFRMWVEDLPDRVGVPPSDAPQRRAASLTDAALTALGLAPPPAETAPGPHLAGLAPGDAWFCYLHYMDPHGAYDPPPEHALFRSAVPDPIPTEEELPPDPIQRVRVAEYNAPASTRIDGGAAGEGRIDAARVRDLYDGEVHYVDAEVGRLLDRLRAAGMLENTLVVITADHGESLGEHRYWFEHGFYCYEATCRVPLVVLGPGVRPGVVDADASLVDLAPTLLEMCDLPALRPPAGRESGPRGESLAALLRGARDEKRTHAVFSEKIERQDLTGTVQAKAVRIGDWKLIRRYTHVDPATGTRDEPLVLSEELYDLERDPGETRNLAADPPAGAPLPRLSAELVRFAAADVRFADLAQDLQRRRERLEREDPETVRILEALGY